MADQDLVQVLTKSGLLDSVSLSRARAEAVLRQRGLAEIVIDMGYVDERTLAEAIAREGEMQLEERVDLENAGRLARHFPTHLARRHQVVPIAEDDGVLVVAAIDPFEPGLNRLIASTTGREIRLIVGPRSEIEKAVLDVFGADEEAEITLFAPKAMSLQLDEDGESTPVEPPDSDEASETKAVVDEAEDDDMNRTIHVKIAAVSSSDEGDDSTAPTVARKMSDLDRLAHVERQLFSISRALALIQARLDTLDTKIADLVDWIRAPRSGG